MTTSTAQSPATGQPELPATMRAAVLKRQGEMAMETLPVPHLEPDQVLVQVAAVGVCGSDVHYYEHGRIGDYVVDHPLILGHELSGRITAVGTAVDPARIGQRVAVEPQRPCRTCKQCKAGRYNLCPDIEFYATPPIDGAFAEYVTIQSDFAYDIPDSVSDEAAALIEPLSVGLWACERAGIRPGSRVLIAGAGPIGIIAAQAARAFGATEIYITTSPRTAWPSRWNTAQRTRSTPGQTVWKGSTSTPSLTLPAHPRRSVPASKPWDPPAGSSW
jgi:L-iditol 2-dehydrogenase